MSMGTWVLVAWSVLVAAPFVTGALCFHYGRHHERTEGKHRRTADRLDAQWDEWWAQIRPVTPEPVPTMDEVLALKRRQGYTIATDLKHEVVVPEPKLTDTGELRAIRERGEAIRAAMVTGELAWRTKAGQ